MTTVENLLPHLRSELIFANSGASAAHVRTLMLLNHISRVPIIDGADKSVGEGGRVCRGIVRMRSFFDSPVGEGELPPLKYLMSAAPLEINVKEPLFRAVEQLRGRQELLVRDGNGLLTRMLTPRGLADWWCAYSEPFLVVEELEVALRDMLRPLEGARLFAAVGVDYVQQLNPAHYRQAWQTLSEDLPALADLDAGVVQDILIEFAELRNRLMHFRLDDKPSLDPDLRRFRQLEERIRRVVPAR